MKQRFLPDSKGSAVGCSHDIGLVVCFSLNDVCNETALSTQSGAFCGSVWFISDISVLYEKDVVMLFCPGCCVSTWISPKKPGPADLISEEMFAWMSVFEFEVSAPMKEMDHYYRLS